MKVNKSELMEIVREELQLALDELGNYSAAAGASLRSAQLNGKRDDEEWAQKASDDIEKKGTEGEFTKYCDGDVTQACVDKAAKGSSTKRKRQAAFAANVNSHDDLTYPKGKKKK